MSDGPFVIRREYAAPSYWHGSGFAFDRERAIQFARRADADHLHRLNDSDREWTNARVVPLEDCA